MNLISIVSRGYFGLDTKESYIYYCVDLPEVVASKTISPNVETAENLIPRLSIKS